MTVQQFLVEQCGNLAGVLFLPLDAALYHQPHVYPVHHLLAVFYLLAAQVEVLAVSPNADQFSHDFCLIVEQPTDFYLLYWAAIITPFHSDLQKFL